MKRSQMFICTLILVIFAGCKTQEDIRREQTVQNMNTEIQETKKTAASGNTRFQSIEEQLQRMTNQVEESNHNRSQTMKENQALQERINVLEESNKKSVEYIQALTEKVNNQSGYIEEVISSLAKLTDKPASSSSKKKSVKPDSVNDVEVPATFDNGLKAFKANEYAQSKEIFTDVAANKKASKKNREGATHYLGMIELKAKNYDAAKVHFSKVFSDNPNSVFAPMALLNLGKTFKATKSKEEANMTFDELISRFPKSKEATEAAKLKK